MSSNVEALLWLMFALKVGGPLLYCVLSLLRGMVEPAPVVRRRRP